MRRIPLLLAVAAVMSIAVRPAFSGWHDRPVHWGPSYYMCPNVGLSRPHEGYPNYRDSATVGLDFYAFPGRKSYDLAEPEWTRNFFYRLSLEWIPMMVPEHTYGLTEDFLIVGVDALYTFYRTPRLNLFAGLGAGAYYDVVALDTPASGSKVASYLYYGLRPSAGAAVSISENIEFVAEFRTHLINIVHVYIKGVVTTVRAGVSIRLK